MPSSLVSVVVSLSRFPGLNKSIDAIDSVETASHEYALFTFDPLLHRSWKVAKRAVEVEGGGNGCAITLAGESGLLIDKPRKKMKEK